MATIFTIGHSNYPKEKLLERLRAYGIQRLVDVRTKPYSRYCPQYNRNALAMYLDQNGIVYDFRGSNLGGLDGNINYHETIHELVDRAENEKMAVMCSEKDHLNCHRFSMLAPDFEEAGIEVVHISYEN